MNKAHLRKGELERLCDYLFNHLIIKEDDERFLRETFLNDSNKLAELMSIYNHVKINEYENSSTFGRDYEEIVRNARAHLISCKKCFKSYNDLIYFRSIRSAIIVGNAFQRVGLWYGPNEFIEDYKENIKDYDYLRVLENLE